MLQAALIDTYFEDLVPGNIAEYGNYLVTKEAIIAFAQIYDPQPFHLNDAGGQASMLGGLSASGWHSACILMRLSFDGWIHRTASWGGPGVQGLKWLKPVRPGDVLRARWHIVDKRQSNSRPEMGLATLHSELVNQDDAVVMMQDNVVMLGLRGQKIVPSVRKILPNTSRPVVEAGDLPCWYEDVEVGATTTLGAFHFTAANIVEFARQFDPQPFHLDEAAAKASHFGGLVASGWQTACVQMRMLVDARNRTIAAQPEGSNPQSGPSPGVRDLAWPRPVYAGDEIFYTTEVLSKRLVSRQGWGLVESRNIGVNQHGQPVFNLVAAGFYPLRR